jgi:hypothetical protein
MKLQFLFAAIFLGLFIAFGIGFMAHALRSAWKSTRAASWPTTPAKVTHAEVRQSNSSDEPTYRVEVKYTYSVNNVDYHGSRVAFGYNSSSESGSQYELCNRIKNAKAIDVRYDPANPASSCLSFGLHQSIQFAFLFATAWLTIFICLALIFWLGASPDYVLLDNLSIP